MNRLFDSNILIYYLNSALDASAKPFVDRAVAEGASISLITRIEVLGWPNQPADARQRVRQWVDLFQEYPLTSRIAEQCIELRQQRRIGVPDAIIAATALDLGLPLVTRNVDDFKWIVGLSLINPFEST